MKRLTNRRSVLLAAGTAAVAAVAAAGAVAAQARDISGTIVLADGTAIPKGQIEIYLENTAMEDNARGLPATTSLESDGGAKSLTYTFTPPAGFTASSTQQIVARLERADGWLLARGSAPSDAEGPIDIVLYTVMY